jgi:hypothetical protein
MYTLTFNVVVVAVVKRGRKSEAMSQRAFADEK